MPLLFEFWTRPQPATGHACTSAPRLSEPAAAQITPNQHPSESGANAGRDPGCSAPAAVWSVWVHRLSCRNRIRSRRARALFRCAGRAWHSQLSAAVIGSVWVATAMVLLRPGAALAQQAPAPSQPLSFAVVSVKPFSPPAGPYPVCVRQEDPEMYSLQACTLTGLVIQALDLESNSWELLDSAPKWTNSMRFTLTARTKSPTSHEERMGMLLNALKSRFGLVLRKEKIKREVYLLERSGNKLRLAAASDPSSSKCGQGGWGFGKIQFSCGTIRDLTGTLSDLVFHAPVLDHTGLPATSKYKILIRVDPKLMPFSPLTAKFAEINQAMKAQVGLRLSTTHTVMPVVVMVSAHRPTSN